MIYFTRLFRKYNIKSITPGFLSCSRWLCSIFIVVFAAFCYTSANHAMGQEVSTIKIDSVSVIDNNNIIIGWTLNTSVQEGYIEVHQRMETGLYAVIITVPLNRTFYLHSGVDASAKSYSYFVVARYPNGDPIAVSNEAHQTLLMNEPAFFVCDKLFSITWQNYALTTTFGQPQPLPSPFNRNRIMLSFNYSNFAAVLQMGLDPQVAAVHAGQSGFYCMKIVSVNTETGVTASSNQWCKEVVFPPKPQYLNVRALSVGPASEKIEIILDADNNVPDPAYIIQRYNPDSLLFYSIDTIVSSLADIRYTDALSIPGQRSEIYRVNVLDSCRVQVLQTDPVGSVFLNLTTLSAYENILTWSMYEGWEEGPVEYVVQKRTDANDPFENIAFLTPTTFNYTDELSPDGNDAQTGKIFYRIKAVGNTSSVENHTDTVYSNVVSMERELAVFIPNAFNPLSQNPQNRVFKPMFSFFSPDSYSMQMYDRWGGRIFETDNHEEAWDGRLPNGEAPAGAYSYVIRYKDASGKEREKRGVVVLLR